MAMNHTLRIQLSSIEGAIIRALGLMERRGYRICKCTISDSDGNSRKMEVTVTSTRSGDLLQRQLERLHDVYHVELLPAAIVKPHIQGMKPVIRRV
jgi:acetolactate synthase II small subunit